MPKPRFGATSRRMPFQDTRSVRLASARLRGVPRALWAVWALAVVAVLIGYIADRLNTGAFAGAYALLIALAGAEYLGEGRTN